MGVDLNQLQKAFGLSKTYSDTELSEAEKRISALLQALYEVIQGNYKDPFQIEDGVGIEDTPVGHIMAFMGTKVPKHYLACDGKIINIEDYPALASHMIEHFGKVNYFGGDGTTTFKIPDLRGEFLRGAGPNSHPIGGAGGEVGEHQTPTRHLDLRYSSYCQTWVAGAAHTDIETIDRDAYSVAGSNTQGSNSRPDTNYWDIAADLTPATHYTSRPTNTSVLYCIKYEPTYYLRVGPDAMTYEDGETRIGTWKDGKPLYRKFIFAGNNVQGETVVPINVSGLSEIISMTGYARSDRVGWDATIPFTSQGGEIMGVYYDRAKKSITVCASGKYENAQVSITIELLYTKTV